tara:strand:- start:295 stop:648 length:354 start_codon:yes stop_codon:yes gene_type:complete
MKLRAITENSEEDNHFDDTEDEYDDELAGASYWRYKDSIAQPVNSRDFFNPIGLDQEDFQQYELDREAEAEAERRGLEDIAKRREERNKDFDPIGGIMGMFRGDNLDPVDVQDEDNG